MLKKKALKKGILTVRSQAIPTAVKGECAGYLQLWGEKLSLWRSRTTSLFPLYLKVRVWGCSKLLTGVVTHPDLRCCCFVFWTLRGPIQVNLFPLEERERIQTYFSFWIKRFDLGNDCLRILSLGCLNNRMFFSTITDLLVKVLKQVTDLVVLCITLKKSFVFFPLMYQGIKVYWKLKAGKLTVFTATSSRYYPMFLFYYFHLCLHSL